MATVTSCSIFVLVLILLCIFKANVVRAAEFKVGDNTGWTNPKFANLDDDFYGDWVHNVEKNHAFVVGDILHFVYNNSFHNVLQVKKRDYDPCSNSSPIATYTDGDTRVILNGTKDWHFICGFPGHCNDGQKFTIEDVKEATPGNAPAANETGSKNGAPSRFEPAGATMVATIILSTITTLMKL